MALRDNLVSWWEFNETSGTRVDAHGSNDLTDNNTVTSTTGKQGNAARFERSNTEYLSITDASQSGLDLTGDFSLSVWIQIPQAPVSNEKWHIISKSDGGSDRAYQFRYGDQDATDAFQVGLSSDGTGTGFTLSQYNVTLTASTWYHVVLTYDASAGTVDLWINNSNDFTDTNQETSIYNSGQSFFVGNGTGFGGADMDMDEMGIWSRVLEDAEIASLYNSGNGLSYAGTAESTITKGGLALTGVGV